MALWPFLGHGPFVSATRPPVRNRWPSPPGRKRLPKSPPFGSRFFLKTCLRIWNPWQLEIALGNRRMDRCRSRAGFLIEFGWRASLASSNHASDLMNSEMDLFGRPWVLLLSAGVICFLIVSGLDTKEFQISVSQSSLASDVQKIPVPGGIVSVSSTSDGENIAVSYRKSFAWSLPLLSLSASSR